MEETEYVPAWVWESREDMMQQVFAQLILHLERNVAGFSAAALRRETLAMSREVANRLEDNVVTAQMRVWNEEIIDAMLPPGLG